MVFQSIVLYSWFFLFMLIFSFFASRQGYTSSNNLLNKQSSPSFISISTLVPIFIFAIFFGIRYDVGSDYLAYLYGYKKHVDVGKGEVLFTTLTHLFQNFNLHFSWYFGVIALIQAFFFFLAFNRDRFIFPLLTFFLFMNGDFMFWMNGIRQSLALCIWVYALKFIEEKSWWKYLICCLVAIGFHRSAVSLILLYPLLRSGKDYLSNINLQLILFGSAFLLQLIISQLFTNAIPFLEAYFSFLGNDIYVESLKRGVDVGNNTFEGSSLAYFFRIGLSVVIILFSKKLKQFYNSKRFQLLYFLFFLGLFTLYLFPVGAIVLTRPFRYFYVFQFIMYAYFSYYLYKSNNINYKIAFIGIIVVFLAIFYLNQVTANINSHLWYQTYFQQK